jgi:S-adenosylmethionine hydrolase
MKTIRILLLFLLACNLAAFSQNKIVVLQSDFGLKDGAVAAMKGVAMTVDPALRLFDLTHEIPAYNIWEAAYRLQQTVAYWPKGTVFVSVVDPGVGTDRKSVVLKTRSGHFIVTPDNGTLTLLASSLGVAAVREIDEAVNRRKGSKGSYTFHGRDVYAYTAARLAAGKISFEQVGPLQAATVVTLPYQEATVENNLIKGNIPVLDVQYGNIWTNIGQDILNTLHPQYGDVFHVIFYHQGRKVFETDAPYEQTFGEVPVGQPLAYLNSLMELSFALNQGNFAAVHQIGSGNEWSVEVSLPAKR